VRDGLATMKHLLGQGLPTQVVALLLIRTAKEIRDLGDDKTLAGMLATMWLEIAPQLLAPIKEDRNTTFAVAACFLEQYFGKCGDWEEMEKHIVTALKKRGFGGGLDALLAASSRAVHEVYKDLK
jgi:hypothetical protein